jgi:hypothetical protein
MGKPVRNETTLSNHGKVNKQCRQTLQSWQIQPETEFLSQIMENSTRREPRKSKPEMQAHSQIMGTQPEMEPYSLIMEKQKRPTLSNHGRVSQK